MRMIAAEEPGSFCCFCCYFLIERARVSMNFLPVLARRITNQVIAV